MPSIVQNQPLSVAASAKRSSAKGTGSSAADAKVCWIEVKQYPYQPDQQVELLHLQAEADALLIMLQATSQRQVAQRETVAAL